MPTESGERIFTSWKDIAAFFGKGVRTVQRWEQKFGLPISRPTASKNVVLTTESELREWIRKASAKLAADEGSGITVANPQIAETLAELRTRLEGLEEENDKLSRIVATFAERIHELSTQTSSSVREASSTDPPSSAAQAIE